MSKRNCASLNPKVAEKSAPPGGARGATTFERLAPSTALSTPLVMILSRNKRSRISVNGSAACAGAQPIAVQSDPPAGLTIGADRQGAPRGGGFRADPVLGGGGEGDEDGAGPQDGERGKR